ncbi:hypothetical protein EJV47_18170 [Hymenobacter gummosus]|uniref:Lipoprotein n=1 Tax=Hymenobacter gummosus TaxID=1776032 RepID=A0A431TZI1_9BACT|nr:hypothetical protein [Hymenobacter gummosus]RTQ47845.1 hypothetical protein EJV47_18170 [Hymenobacter gummosus]
MLRRTIPGLLLSGLLACQSQSTENQSPGNDAVATVPATTVDSPAPAVPKPAPAPPAPALPPVSKESYPYTIPPVDQTRDDAALQSFVQRVLRACARRDQAALLALVDDSVDVSMGGGLVGKRDFVTDFLNAPRKGQGFQHLADILRLGGTVQRDSAGHLTSATFPYLQDAKLYQRNRQLDQLSTDPFATYVGTAPGIVVHEQPSARSRVLRRLDYPVLLSDYGNTPAPAGSWLQVTAADSSFRGYTDARRLYCLAGVMLIIQPRNGRLLIRSVAPYD